MVYDLRSASANCILVVEHITTKGTSALKAHGPDLHGSLYLGEMQQYIFSVCWPTAPPCKTCGRILVKGIRV